MNTQINITGGIQESGTFEIRQTLSSDSDAKTDGERRPDLVPTGRVVEQVSSGIAPGLSVPLAR